MVQLPCFGTVDMLSARCPSQRQRTARSKLPSPNPRLRRPHAPHCARSSPRRMRRREPTPSSRWSRPHDLRTTRPGARARWSTCSIASSRQARTAIDSARRWPRSSPASTRRTWWAWQGSPGSAGSSTNSAIGWPVTCCRRPATGATCGSWRIACTPPGRRPSGCARCRRSCSTVWWPPWPPRRRPARGTAFAAPSRTASGCC